MAEIIGRESPHRVIVIRAAGGTDALHKELLQMPSVQEAHVVGEDVEIRVDGSDEIHSEILTHLVGKGFRIIDFRQRRMDLEDVFMTVTKGEVQ